MFNIGWGELLLIAVVVLFAFGPEDIPKIMYNLGRIMRRFRYMRYALSNQFEDFMQKAEGQARTKDVSAPIEVTSDDEGSADEYLIDMLPTPKESEPQEPNDRPDTTPDRG